MISYPLFGFIAVINGIIFVFTGSIINFLWFAAMIVFMALEYIREEFYENGRY